MTQKVLLDREDALSGPQNIDEKIKILQNFHFSAIDSDLDLQNVIREKKVKTHKHGEKRTVFPDDSSYISISNTSLRDAAVEVEEQDELSLSATFGYEQMRRIFERYETLANLKGFDMFPETLLHLKEVFAFLTEQDEIVEQLYDSILMVDNTFPRRFIEFAHINNPSLGYLTILKSKVRDLLTRHIKKILVFHGMIIDALLEDKKKADNFMNLLGLSHYLMRISIDDFEMFSLSCIKLLLHLNIYNEENVIHAVGYFCTITKYVRITIDEYYREREKLILDIKRKTSMEIHSLTSLENMNDDSLDENLALILSKGGTENLWARKNYRAMKDWVLIQREVRRKVNSSHPVAAESLLYVDRLHGEMVSIDKNPSKTIQRASSSDSDPQRVQETCFLTWLKKGYKFKKKDKIFKLKYT